jgi:hypothetical protein
MFDPTNTSAVYPSGLAAKNIQLSLPLRRDLFFLATHKSPRLLVYLPADEEFVKAANFATCRYANRFIAGPSKTFPGSADILPRPSDPEATPPSGATE